MPELSSNDAAQVIGTTSETIRRYIDREILPARQFGLRGIIRIDVDDLKKFANEYGFRFDDQMAAQLAE